MDRYDELLQKRAALVTEQRRLLDKAENEDRNLTSEEKTAYDRMDADFDSLEERIELLKDQRERQRNLALAERGEIRERPDTETRAKDEAFLLYLRQGEIAMSPEQRKMVGVAHNEVELRDLSKGTDASGGFTVPEDFFNQLVNKLEEQSGVRRAGARVIRTAGGNDLPIPKVTAHAAASWVSEAAALSAADDTFAQATLGAFKAVKLVKVSLELLQDTGVDIVGYIANEIGRAVGRLAGDAYATGTSGSTTTPEGVVNKATVGVTAASGTAITADEVIDLVYSVSEPYRNNGSSFLMNDSIVKLVRKLKDGNSQYLWQPGMQSGEPDRLLGYPVFREPSMDGAPAINDKVMVFGDMSGYFIRDINAFSVRRLDERYADTMQVGFLGWFRTDGDLIDTNAVKVLQMAAA